MILYLIFGVLVVIAVEIGSIGEHLDPPPADDDISDHLFPPRYRFPRRTVWKRVCDWWWYR